MKDKPENVEELFATEKDVALYIPENHLQLNQWGMDHGILEKVKSGWRVTARYDGGITPCIIETIILKRLCSEITSSYFMTSGSGDGFIAWDSMSNEVAMLSCEFKCCIRNFWERSRTKALDAWAKTKQK